MKTGKILLCTILTACVMLAAIPALGDVRASVQYDTDTGALRVSCQGLYVGTDYALAILKAGTEEWTPENLLFLDQLMASDNGTLEAAFIYPDMPSGVVCLSGPTEEGVSPLRVGVLSSQGGILVPPSALARIEDEAFANCPFAYVYLGSQVQSIGDGAFQNCANLREIHIPDNATEFGEDVFAGCGQVVIVCGENSAALAYAQANGIAYRIQ